MLYLLGGPPRAGKTRITERFCAEAGIGWLSMDTIRDLARTLNPDVAAAFSKVGSDLAVEAEAMYPSFELVAGSSSYLAGRYMIEGVGFMPGHIRRLPDWIERRACFVGVSELTYEQLDDHAGRNDWHRWLPANEQAKIVPWLVHWSTIVEQECRRWEIPYVDMAGDWQVGAEQVRRILRGDDTQEPPPNGTSPTADRSARAGSDGQSDRLR